jgi:hypothetical protein
MTKITEFRSSTGGEPAGDIVVFDTGFQRMLLKCSEECFFVPVP